MSEQETAIEKEQYSIHGLLKELGEYYEEDRGVVLNTVYPKLLRKQVCRMHHLQRGMRGCFKITFRSLFKEPAECIINILSSQAKEAECTHWREDYAVFCYNERFDGHYDDVNDLEELVEQFDGELLVDVAQIQKGLHRLAPS